MRYALSDYEGKDTARIIELDKNVTGEGPAFFNQFGA